MFRKVQSAQLQQFLFRTDEELFPTAKKVTRGVRIEGVQPRKEASVREKNLTVAGRSSEVEKAAANVFQRTVSAGKTMGSATDVKAAIRTEISDTDIPQRTIFRRGINTAMCRRLVEERLNGKTSLEDIKELLQFVDSAKGEIDEPTFHDLRGKVMKRFCEELPTGKQDARKADARKADAKGLYASREHFHLGNIQTIKDPEIKKMCQDIDRELSETLKEHDVLDPEFIDDYMHTMSEAVALVNSASAYISQAPEEKKEVLRLTRSAIDDVLSPGKKKGLLRRTKVTWEDAKEAVSIQKQKLDLLTQVSTLHQADLEFFDNYNQAVASIRNAKTTKQLDTISNQINEAIFGSDQGETGSSGEGSNES